MRHGDRLPRWEYICPEHSVTCFEEKPPVCWIAGCDVEMVRAWNVIGTAGGFEPHPSNAKWSHSHHVRFMYYQEGYPYAS